MGYRCDKETYQSLKDHSERLLYFVNQYKWLSEAYVVEFFVKDHWSNFPRTWRSVLENLDTVDMAGMLLESSADNTGIKYSTVWPLSLLAYRATAHAIALKRTPQHGDDRAVEHLLKKTSTSYDPLSHHYKRHVKPKKQYEICRLAKLIHETWQKCNCSNVVDVGAGMGHLTRLLSFGYGLHVTTVEAEGGHVGGALKLDDKLKQFYETKSVENPDKLKGLKQSDCSPDIPVLPSHVIFHIDPNIAVDDFLALLQQHKCETTNTEKNMSLETIDADQRLGTDPGDAEQRLATDTSNKMSDAEQKMKQKCDSVDGQVTETTQLDMDHSQRDAEVNNPSSPSSPQSEAGSPTRQPENQPTNVFGFVGLHTCGDLGPTIMRVFSKCTSANTLVSVGCCYQKLTCKNAAPARHPNELEEQDATRIETFNSTNPQIDVENQKIDQVGYPMSEWIKSLPDYELNYESRELACHAVDAYCQRLKDRDPNLILQCYRAILEIIIQRQQPSLTTKVNGIRHLKKIMHKIKKSHDKPLAVYLSQALINLGLQQISESEEKEFEELLKHWRRLITFHVLRLLTAPIIESLVLLDRALYLYEQGIDCELIPLFDPQLSARNFVLVANKTQHASS